MHAEEQSRTQCRVSLRSLLRAGTAIVLVLMLSNLYGAAAGAIPEPLRLTGWQLQDAVQVCESGEAISRAGYRPAAWHPATVPGTVLTSLVNDGTYPEPLFGENNRSIPESLCRASYWYRTTVSLPPSFAGKRVWLNFEGINYRAEVWVNGCLAGTIKGAFTRGNFDISSWAIAGETNAVAVHVFPQPHPGEPHEKSVAKGAGLNGGATSQDGPTFLCAVGWDWIPTIRDRVTGLWQAVTVSASGPVVVQDPYVTSELPLPRTDTADLTVQTTLRNVTDRPQTGRLTGTIEGIRFEQEVSLAPQETRLVTFTPAATAALRLKQPKLWWPHGFGPQNLYTLRLAFAVAEGVSDAREMRFGVRQITYALPGSDNLALSVNGVPVFAKGGNWGMDEAMKRIPRQRLEAQIRLHQLANYTILRNWVGQSTSEDLYDLCDQYGILVWDEFFQPNPGDGPNPEDVNLYLANVREKILRFRHHCCIALWCARNEGPPPPIIGQGLQKLVAELDPRRLYQPSSTAGRGVISGGPYHWRRPREFYTFPAKEIFKTELGAMSVPTLEAIQAMMPASDWGVIGDVWAQHDFSSGWQAGDRYPGMLNNRYGRLSGLADFARKAQLANYEAYRAMYEGRQAKMFHPVTGLLVWMSNPAQPSFAWQLYSHDLEPHASLYGTRKACEPIHIQLNQDDWRLMVINNTAAPLTNWTARCLVYNLDGSLRHSRSQPVFAAPSAATDLGAMAFPDRLSAVHFIKLELRDAANRLVSDNFYWRTTPEREENFQALDTLPTVALEIQAERHEAQGKCLLDVSIRNPSQAVALMAHLQLRQARSGRRVLPVFYSDNYISLLSGESRSLTVEAAAADLNGEEPLLAVDGWNVTVAPTAASSDKAVLVVANTAAQARGVTEEARRNEPIVFANINCGGGQLGCYRFGEAAAAVWERDYLHVWNGKGDHAVSETNRIDTTARSAGPEALYRTERVGSCTYTLPVNKGSTYTVRLHFAEVEQGPGKRKFNVDVNDCRVLTDYDIAAQHGMGKAVVKEYPSLTPDANGNLTVTLTAGSIGEPKLCGLQILVDPPVPQLGKLTQ